MMITGKTDIIMALIDKIFDLIFVPKEKYDNEKKKEKKHREFWIPGFSSYICIKKHLGKDETEEKGQQRGTERTV